MNKKNYQYVANVDGACMGNPGKMGVGGIIIKNPEQETITFSKSLGKGTNNQAEYLAVITALERLSSLKPQSILILSDSQLVINQINGVYHIRDFSFIKPMARILNLVNDMKCTIDFMWIPREKNKVADALASRAAGMPVTRIINDCTVDDWKSDPNYVPETSKLEELPKLIEQCSREIRKLILLGEQAKFKDYAELKVGGIDGYSGANTGTLNLYIATRHGDNAVQWLTDVLLEAEKGYTQRALRWAARGLPPDMALKKASVDTEISVNAENRKKRRRRFFK